MSLRGPCYSSAWGVWNARYRRDSEPILIAALHCSTIRAEGRLDESPFLDDSFLLPRTNQRDREELELSTSQVLPAEGNVRPRNDRGTFVERIFVKLYYVHDAILFWEIGTVRSSLTLEFRIIKGCEHDAKDTTRNIPYAENNESI